VDGSSAMVSVGEPSFIESWSREDRWFWRGCVVGMGVSPLVEKRRWGGLADGVEALFEIRSFSAQFGRGDLRPLVWEDNSRAVL